MEHFVVVSKVYDDKYAIWLEVEGLLEEDLCLIPRPMISPVGKEKEAILDL